MSRCFGMTKSEHLKFLVPKAKNGLKKAKQKAKKVKQRVNVILRDQDIGAIAKAVNSGFRHGSGAVAGPLGGLAGRAIGRGLGINSKKTSAIGRQAGMLFSKITGYGDYTVSDNTLLKPSPVPDFGTQSIRVTHKEFLGNIYGSVDFSYITYPLNPGISKTFPWLAGIARNYQQYHINGLIFQYVSTSAFALGSTNSALGKVMLATNYNAEDPAFESTVQMMATQYSNYCRPADSIMHAIECSPSETPNKVYYIRTEISEDAKDLRLSDIGFTEVATEGMQSTSEVGGLWISYDITLLKPILNPQTTLVSGFDQFDLATPDVVGNALYDAKISIRNNRLSGTLVADTVADKFVYSFAPSLQTGYFMCMLEVSGSPDSKFSPVDYIINGFVNCATVTDNSGYGPFNGKYYQTTSLTSRLQSGLVATGPFYGETVVFGSILEINKNPASFTLSAFNSQGTKGFYMRLHIFPVPYDPTPDDSKNS